MMVVYADGSTVTIMIDDDGYILHPTVVCGMHTVLQAGS